MPRPPFFRTESIHYYLYYFKFNNCNSKESKEKGKEQKNGKEATRNAKGDKQWQDKTKGRKSCASLFLLDFCCSCKCVF